MVLSMYAYISLRIIFPYEKDANGMIGMVHLSRLRRPGIEFQGRGAAGALYDGGYVERVHLPPFPFHLLVFYHHLLIIFQVWN